MRKHIKHLRNEKGLTLIELLAVIVILGIIAAIAIPMIGNVVEDSREKAAVNEALNIISAAKQAYALSKKNAETPVEFEAADLKDYIKINSDDVKVEFDGSDWKISDHDAIDVPGVDKNDDGNATETELQSWLKNGDENTKSGS